MARNANSNQTYVCMALCVRQTPTHTHTHITLTLIYILHTLPQRLRKFRADGVTAVTFIACIKNS